jgi:hypothetical protein
MLAPVAESRYHAYLIRLWQDQPASPWRASAQSVQSGEVMRFGSLDALYAFLRAETGAAADSNDD